MGIFVSLMSNPLVQYVIVRRDLIQKFGWPVGPVIAQACHASVAALFRFVEDPKVKEYTTQLESMHKVILEVSSEDALRNLSKKLTEAQIDHHLWQELPEEIPTALATKPDTKDTLRPYFKKCKLFK